MIETIYKLNQSENKLVEKIIMSDEIQYIHMIFNKNEGLPEHFSNAPVYMTVIRGQLSIRLNEQDLHEYPAGTLLNIPINTKMNVSNLNDAVLELIVVKTPILK